MLFTSSLEDYVFLNSEYSLSRLGKNGQTIETIDPLQDAAALLLRINPGYLYVMPNCPHTAKIK
jgi:hypothetical protein